MLQQLLEAVPISLQEVKVVAVAVIVHLSEEAVRKSCPILDVPEPVWRYSTIAHCIDVSRCDNEEFPASLIAWSIMELDFGTVDLCVPFAYHIAWAPAPVCFNTGLNRVVVFSVVAAIKPILFAVMVREVFEACRAFISDGVSFVHATPTASQQCTATVCEKPLLLHLFFFATIISATAPGFGRPPLHKVFERIILPGTPAQCIFDQCVANSFLMEVQAMRHFPCNHAIVPCHFPI
jgi:hypothetical protein